MTSSSTGWLAGFFGSAKTTSYLDSCLDASELQQQPPKEPPPPPPALKQARRGGRLRSRNSFRTQGMPSARQREHLKCCGAGRHDDEHPRRSSVTAEHRQWLRRGAHHGAVYGVRPKTNENHEVKVTSSQRQLARAPQLTAARSRHAWRLPASCCCSGWFHSNSCVGGDGSKDEEAAAVAADGYERASHHFARLCFCP